MQLFFLFLVVLDNVTKIVFGAPAWQAGPHSVNTRKTLRLIIILLLIIIDSFFGEKTALEIAAIVGGYSEECVWLGGSKISSVQIAVKFLRCQEPAFVSVNILSSLFSVCAGW